MKTYYIVYLNGAGVEEELSASGSDAYSFAQEIEEEHSDGVYYGMKIVRQGWRNGL